MNVMRFNIIDPSGTVSFVGPSHASKILTAACAHNPRTLVELLTYSEAFDTQLKQFVLNGLAVFDEHNSEVSTDAIHEALASGNLEMSPPFRVIDSVTREASLEPVQSGLVIYNLPAKRIIQVQNTYSDLQRQDRGRIWRNGEPTTLLYHYKLPKEWVMVP